MTDALEMFRAMRAPTPNADSEDIRAPASRGSRDLHDLAMVPGSPAYRARIPLPPCVRCGEDHHPTLVYDHPWEGESVQAPIHDEPVSATAISRRPPTVDVSASAWSGTSRRVALYVGRGDSYVLAIEDAPDWDSVETFKVADPTQLIVMVRLARALGVKIADKTGGDLFMLEEEARSASEHAQADGRGAPPLGDPGPRRQGPAADGPPEGEPEDPAEADGGVPGGSNQRRHTPRRQER